MSTPEQPLPGHDRVEPLIRAAAAHHLVLDADRPVVHADPACSPTRAIARMVHLVLPWRDPASNSWHPCDCSGQLGRDLCDALDYLTVLHLLTRTDPPLHAWEEEDLLELTGNDTMRDWANSASASPDTFTIGLPTIGADLHAALDSKVTRPDLPSQVVVRTRWPRLSPRAASFQISCATVLAHPPYPGEILVLTNHMVADLMPDVERTPWPDPMTPAQLELLAATWDPMTPTREQLEAIRAATL